eukprot:CAMPEP_0196997866 /NCGR_PEP_ID=MMETSP1380-20130617/3376_1 /TAXON_ID=5936 /ORGANISM="Euplotes crassus, Strain CT5" /LENGTH=96 /DNA_ID=CAMNT_0042414233 /DNA_START=63 /DNA_END=353 /DNA_ORIENTATION=+
MATSVNAACNINVVGYDCKNDLQIGDFIGIIVGYLLMTIMLLYVIIRLFVEEKVRYTDYKVQMEEAEKEAEEYGINYDELVRMDKEKAENDENKKF